MIKVIIAVTIFAFTIIPYFIISFININKHWNVIEERNKYISKLIDSIIVLLFIGSLILLLFSFNFFTDNYFDNTLLLIFYYIFIPLEIFCIIYVLLPSKIHSKYRIILDLNYIDNIYKNSYIKRYLGKLFIVSLYNIIIVIILISVFFFINNIIPHKEHVYFRTIVEIKHEHLHIDKPVHDLNSFDITKDNKYIEINKQVIISVSNGLFNIPVYNYLKELINIKK